ncbi:hypothetical protein NGM10_17215 (plasmid) [Halorussus salilacus]|uniref:hypothetical protein n=1 Tax=Halorussus salilacus TaxID=2953750 RepID=UPI0020A02D06|nr:hypothetical protein [Halorussus salilacus]USZ70068.1 hypothetical protein NGM10_17215 [Halorussus salilacus]
MAARSMRADLNEQFSDDVEEAFVYYSRRFSRPQVEKLAKLESVDLEKESIEDDCKKLYEEGVLQEFHEYNAELDGIGPSTIVEGIRAIDRDKMKILSDTEMHDKTALLLRFYEWDWKDKLELIQALKTFKNKRTYQREEIDGDKKYDDLTDNEVEQLERILKENISEANERRKYKARLNSVNLLGENEVIAKLDIEYKSGNFRQFKFRQNENLDYKDDGGRDVEPKQYWPIATRYIHVDYENDEYDHNIRRSEEDFVNPVLSALYDSVDYGDNVRFVDPVEHADKTPKEFVEDRVDKQKEVVEDSSLEDEEKDEYKEILDDFSTAEQTAIVLENVNVPGDPTRIEIQTNQPIQSFADGNNMKSQLDKFNKKSQRREYTLELGNREIQVSGTKMTIFGDVSKEEEEMITSILREDSS